MLRAKYIDWKEKKTKMNSEAENLGTKVRLGANFEKHRRRIERLLEPCEEMWNGQLGELEVTEHGIQLTHGSKSVHQAPYRAGPLQRKMQNKEIENMLEKCVREGATTD